MNGITVKVVAGILLLLVSFLLGQSTLGSRVTILETNYVHIKETMKHFHEKIDTLLRRE